jgi:hypothetical protein
MHPSNQLRIHLWIYFFIALSISAELLILNYLGLKIVSAGTSLAFIIISVCTLISAYYYFIRRDDLMIIFCNALPQLMCGSFAIGVGTYISAYMSMPLVDEKLIAIDAMLGFDWRNYMLLIDSTPWLANVLTFAYDSTAAQMVILLSLLFFQHSAHAQRVYIVLLFSGALTIILSGLFPAVGAYIFYHYDSTVMPSIPASARIHEEFFMALYHHTIDTITHPNAGVVTFPSFHTVFAVVLFYASLPYKWLRFPSFALNALMIAATPFNGGHYLADIIGGIIITVMGIYIAERILPRNVRSPLEKR